MRHVYTSLPPDGLHRPSFEGSNSLTRPQPLTSTYALLWAKPRDPPYHCPSAEVQTLCIVGS